MTVAELKEMASMDKKRTVPSEYALSEKWDKCIENFLVHFSAGAVAGGLASLVLARNGTSRGLITGFSAGSGTGSSWTTCQMAFRGDSDAEKQFDASSRILEDVKRRVNKSSD